MFEPYIKKISPRKIVDFGQKKFIDQPMELIGSEGVGTGLVYIFRKEKKQILVSEKGSITKMTWDELVLKNSITIEKNESTDLCNYIFGDKNLLILKKDATENYLVFCNQSFFTEINFNIVAQYIYAHAASHSNAQSSTKKVVLTVHSNKTGHTYLHSEEQKASDRIIHKEKRARRWVDTLNSTVMVLFAQLFFYGVYLLLTKLSLKIMGFDAIYENFKFVFVVPPGNPFWDVLAKTVTYMSGPLVAITFAAIASWPYNYFYKKNGIHKLFFLWFYLYGLTFFFGSYISGFFTHTWLGEIPTLLGLSKNFSYGFLLVSLIAMVWIGLQANKGFVHASWSRMFISKPIKQLQYKNRVIWFPYTVSLVVSGIIYWVGADVYFLLINLSMLPMLLASLKNIDEKETRVVPEKKPQKICIMYILLLTFVILLFVLWSVF